MVPRVVVHTAVLRIAAGVRNGSGAGLNAWLGRVVEGL